jgi:glycosyltransferase involved in cell wall biosynthesis
MHANAHQTQHPLVMPEHVGSQLKRAMRLANEGDHAGALEGIASAAIADIQAAQQEFLGDIRGVGVFAEVTRLWLAQWIAARSETPSPRAPADVVRLLYVVPNVSAGHAASMNLVRLVEWHTRQHERAGAHGAIRVEPTVLVCEEFTERTPPRAHLSFKSMPSRTAGADFIARLEKRCRVEILAADGTYLDAAEAGIAHARAARPDVAFFVGSPACAVQTAIAAARVAPVQACLNIGVPMLSPGIDAVIYNNRAKEARDEAFVRAHGAEVLGVTTSGGDASIGARLAPFPRGEMGLPDGVPVVASMSNVLVRRMLAGTFARDLAAFLRRNPDVWWLGIGFCDPAPFHKYLETVDGGADIRRRCVFAGGWQIPWGMLKSCNVLLNEYPEGGGNSVIETMGCGVPVVAMQAGPRHAECIGAELVGPDAIPTNDIDAYWRLAETWIRDPQAAAAAGARQRARALAELDYGVICDAYERIAVDLCRRRVWAASAAELATADT